MANAPSSVSPSPFAGRCGGHPPGCLRQAISLLLGSEAEVHWRHFLRSLQARGLISCASITSDAHEGLKATLTSVYPGVPWNRCQFHLQQHAQAYVPRQNLKEQVAADIRAIFHAEDLPHAQARLAATVEKYTATAPALARWMEANLPQAFTIFAFPEPVRQRLPTSNLCEALNKQIRRRTRLASIFPNPQSCLRLVSAILMEISEHWEDAKAYLNPQILTPPTLPFPTNPFTHF